jgi:hypothetical protein
MVSSAKLPPAQSKPFGDTNARDTAGKSAAVFIQGNM